VTLGRSGEAITDETFHLARGLEAVGRHDRALTESAACAKQAAREESTARARADCETDVQRRRPTPLK
jgi:hypothetical protein